MFVPPADNILPINPLLKCGEERNDYEQYEEDDDNDDFFSITFHIQLQSSKHRLNFNCRDKSCGVLLQSEHSVTKEDTYHGRDAFFFEKGFYLEAQTGFQVWPGSRLMVEAFTCSSSGGDQEGVNGMMKYWKDQLSLGGRLNVLEVGAGIGVVGSCLAAAGGNVLITDLPVLVEHGIGPNLRRNARAHSITKECDRQQLCPRFLIDACASKPTSTDTASLDAVPLGKGWAKAAVLDWFQPVEEQLPIATTSNIDVIVACDCIFLRKLVDPLLTTIATIFEHSSANNPKFFFTFQRRNMLGLFIQLEELLGRIEERGWIVECVAWRDVDIEGEGIHENYLFQVTPTGEWSELLDGSYAANRAALNAPFIGEEKKE
jgi:predicted nicotinamide N-methyase